MERMDDAALAGWAFKQGSKVKNWKKRFFVLRGRTLSYYTAPPSPAKEDDEKGRVIVVGAELDALNAMLLVTCERKTQLLKLKPVAPEDAPLWLAALERATGTGVTSPVSKRTGPTVVLGRNASLNATKLFSTDLHDEHDGDDYMDHQRYQGTAPLASVASYYKTAQPLIKPQSSVVQDTSNRGTIANSTLAVDDNQHTNHNQGGNDEGSNRGVNKPSALARGNHIGVAREGWLTVGEPHNPQSWKKRYAVLAGPTLTYFASKGTGDAIASVWVKSVSLSSSRANALDLVLDSHRVLSVVADSRDELMLWERALASVLGTSILLRAASSKEEIDDTDLMEFGDSYQNAGGRPSSYTGVFREGWLLLKQGFGRHEWQRRYFVLNGATLQERETPTSPPVSESYVLHMTVRNDSSMAEFELELMSGRTLCLQAENTVEAEAWIHAVSDLVGTPAVQSMAFVKEPQPTAHLPTPVIRPPVNLPPPKVHKTGWLMKEGGLIKSWKRRYFILDGDALHYFDKVNGGLLGGGIVFRVVHNTATANALDIHFINGRVLRVSSETRVEIDAWFENLRTAADASVHKVQPSSDAPESSFENCPRGWLLKRGQMMKTWKRRYFVIQRNRLTYYNAIGGELLGSGAVFDVTGGNQRPLSLDVRFQNGRLLHIAAADDDDYNRWYDALKSASNISESVLSQNSLSQEETPFGKDFDYDIQDEAVGQEGDDDALDEFADDMDDESSTGYGMWEAAMNGLSRENSWDSDLSEANDDADLSDGAGSTSTELRRRDSDTPSIPDEPRGCSGWLRKEGKRVKNWKRRYFTLHGTAIKYFKSARGSLLRSYEVTQVEEYPAVKFGFAMVTKGGRRLVVSAESNDEYEKWLLALWGVLADQRASLSGGTNGGGADDTRFSAVGAINVKSVPTSPVAAGSAPALPRSHSHSGWLEKEGQRFKTWKRRYFTVKNGALMYFSDIGGETQGHGTVRGVVVDKTKPNTLRILLGKDRVLRVTAASQTETNLWYQVLSATQKPSRSPRGSSPGSEIGDDFSEFASSAGSAVDRRSLGGSAPSTPVAATAPNPPAPPAPSRFDENDYLRNDTITNESFLRIRGPGDELSLTSGSFYKPRSFKGDLAFEKPPHHHPLPTPSESTAETDDTTQLTRVDSEDDLEYLRGSNVDHTRREALRKKKERDELLPQQCAACCIVM